jgi:hypothetical protein
MSDADGLLFRAFTRVAFPTPESALPLLGAFVEAGDPFIPTHYASHEPVRTPFDPADPLPAARMLNERPHELLLKRGRPSLLANVRWTTGRDRPWLWTLRLGATWIRPATCGPNRLAEFLTDLCSRFPPVFAACATNGDWDAKHTVRDQATGDDWGHRGLALNPGEGLPGGYWLTFFGPELVAFFRRERLLALDAHRVLDRSDSGIGILLYESPVEGSPEFRREREAALVAGLGPEYFFNLSDAASAQPHHRTPIPQATDHS